MSWVFSSRSAAASTAASTFFSARLVSGHRSELSEPPCRYQGPTQARKYLDVKAEPTTFFA